MERRETQDILRAISRARAAGRAAALATVVRVTGSAYRREGARMLIEDDGAMTCMLSGGCLEPDLVEVARAVLRTGRAERRHYDLDEAVLWGLGLGCGGSVDVYVEPVTDHPVLTEWLTALERGTLAVLATALSGGEGRVLVGPDGRTEGRLAPEPLEAQVREEARLKLGEVSPRAESRRFASQGVEAEVFLDVSAPPPELVVFGAGHDAIPLTALARDLGWQVTVVDAREAFTTAERFPGARLVVAHPAQFADRLSLGPRSHVIVMNHHFDRDCASLGFAVRSEAAYVGVLGPRARFARLLDRAKAHGYDLPPTRVERVRNPIGLDIGAESPDEVALAIMSALIAERRGFGGGFLYGVAGRIHDPGAR